MRLLSRSEVAKERAVEQRQYAEKKRLLIQEISRLEKLHDIPSRLETINKREQEAEEKMELARRIVEEYNDMKASLNERERSLSKKEEKMKLYEEHLSQVNQSITSLYGSV